VREGWAACGWVAEWGVQGSNPRSPNVGNRIKGGQYRSSAGQNAGARNSGCPAGATEVVAPGLRPTVCLSYSRASFFRI
jgi:hypothetical protein